MKHVIYYPGFEVRSEAWLKFALLYMHRLESIVPPSADMYLSDTYRKVYNETDLISLHRPSPDEAQHATLDAIDMTEKTLRSPTRYAHLLGGAGFVEKWRRPEQQRYVLFQHKYAHLWEEFCVENGLGHKRSIEGVSVARDLGFMYMSILAQAIADGKGISPITDHTDLDRLAPALRQADAKEKRTIAIGRATIDIQLPADLGSVGIDRLIEYRERKGFKDRLHAFHQELEAHIDEFEKGKTDKLFLESLGSGWRDFSDDIAKLTGGLALLGLGVWSVLAESRPDALTYVKGIAAGGALATNAVISITKTWKHTRSRRYARRYLADLGRLRR